jgi:hypothetical protein
MGLDVNPASEASQQDYAVPPVVRAEHLESSFTRLIEQQTAKVPSHVFLFASLCVMAGSATFELLRRDRTARFLGMWVAPLLIMGVYNKMVKTLGPR